MNDQYIIAYRNPLEAWMWESGWAPWFYAALAACVLGSMVWAIVVTVRR